MVFKTPTFHGKEPEAEVEYHTRAALESAVAEAIATSGGLDGCDLKVRANGDEITLDGTVSTHPEIARAIAIAEAVEGVSSVRSSIAVG